MRVTARGRAARSEVRRIALTAQGTPYAVIVPENETTF